MPPAAARPKTISKDMTKRGSGLEKCGLTLAATIVALLLCEAFLRFTDVFIARHSDHMFEVIEYDQRLGWKMKPSHTAKVDLFDTENVLISSNSDGVWDREFTLEPREAGNRIAFLGDSYTWGYSLHAEQRFSALLESRVGVECLNFGIPAYGTDQALLMWRHVVRRYRPDAVVLTIVPNDFVDNVSSVRWGRAKPYFVTGSEGDLLLQNSPPPLLTFWDDGIFHRIADPHAKAFDNPVTTRSRIADWTVKNLDVVRMVHTAVGGLRASRQPNWSYLEKGRMTSIADASEAGVLMLRLLVAVVDVLAKEVAATGAKLLVALAADHRLYGLLEADLLARAITPIDLTTPVLAKRMGVSPADIFFVHTLHWRPETQELVAEMIAEAMRGENLIDD